MFKINSNVFLAQGSYGKRRPVLRGGVTFESVVPDVITEEGCQNILA